MGIAGLLSAVLAVLAGSLQPWISLVALAAGAIAAIPGCAGQQGVGVRRATRPVGRGCPGRAAPRLGSAVPLADLRTRRGAPCALDLQLRRPPAALDLRSVPGPRRVVLAREPDLHRGAAPLSHRHRPRDGPARPGGGAAAGGPGRARAARLGSPGRGPLRLGPRVRGRRVPVLGRSRRPRDPGQPVGTWRAAQPRVEEPLPGAFHPAARLSLRVAVGTGAALELSRAADPRPPGPSGLGRRSPLGKPAPLPRPHLSVRLAADRDLGGGARQGEAGDRAAADRARTGDLVGPGGHRGPACRIDCLVEAGVDDGRAEPPGLSSRLLRRLPSVGGVGARPLLEGWARRRRDSSSLPASPSSWRSSS